MEEEGKGRFSFVCRWYMEFGGGIRGFWFGVFYYVWERGFFGVFSRVVVLLVVSYVGFFFFIGVLTGIGFSFVILGYFSFFFI